MRRLMHRTKDPCQVTGISLPHSLFELVEKKRGLVSRSAYIVAILRKALEAS